MKLSKPSRHIVVLATVLLLCLGVIVLGGCGDDNYGQADIDNTTTIQESNPSAQAQTALLTQSQTALSMDTNSPLGILRTEFLRYLEENKDYGINDITSAYVSDMNNDGILEVAMTIGMWDNPQYVFTCVNNKLVTLSYLFSSSGFTIKRVFQYVEGTNYIIARERGNSIGTNGYYEARVYSIDENGYTLVKTINAGDLGVELVYYDPEKDEIENVESIDINAANNEKAVNAEIRKIIGDRKMINYNDVSVSENAIAYVNEELGA